MKVLFDTNVVIDVAAKREEFFQASHDVFLLATQGSIDGIISAGSITDIYYIVRRSLQNTSLVLEMINKILQSLVLVDTKAQDIKQAIKLPMADFEDAVVASVAQRERASFIITRNINDFSQSPIPAITPFDFLKKHAWNIV
ncbi:MAG: PIN domain-containing protein [Endomicrobium sp.]|jgi:predicted nucleic acid-binding protein|nr:PIN domain-containing protein [Endomicrobium sp.]